MEPMLPKLLKFEEEGESTSRRHRRPHGQRNPFSLQERMKTARVVEELIATVGTTTPIDSEIMPPENPTEYTLEGALEQHTISSAKLMAGFMPLHLPPILPTDGSKPMSVVKDTRGLMVGGRRYIRRDGVGLSAATRLPSIRAAAQTMLDASGTTAAGHTVGCQLKARGYTASEELPGEDKEAELYCNGQAQDSGKGIAIAHAMPTINEEARRTVEARGDRVGGFTSEHTEHLMQDQGSKLTLPTSKLMDGPLLAQGKNGRNLAHRIPQEDCCSATFTSSEAVYGTMQHRAPEPPGCSFTSSEAVYGTMQHRAPEPPGCSQVIMCRPPLPPSKGSGKPIHTRRDGNGYLIGGRRYVTTVKDCWMETQSTRPVPRFTNAVCMGYQADSSGKSDAFGGGYDPAAARTTPKSYSLMVSTDQLAVGSQASGGDNWSNTDTIPDNKVVPSSTSSVSVPTDKQHLSASTAEVCDSIAATCLMVTPLTDNPVHMVADVVAGGSPDQSRGGERKSRVTSATLTLSRHASPSHTPSCMSSLPPLTTASPSHSATSRRSSSFDSSESSPTRGSSTRGSSPTISPPSSNYSSPDGSRCSTASPPPISTPPPTISPLPANSIHPTSLSATVTPIPTTSLSPRTISNDVKQSSKKADSGFEEIFTEDSGSEGEDESQKTEMESSNQPSDEKAFIPMYGASYFSTFQMMLNPSRAPRVQTAVIRRLD